MPEMDSKTSKTNMDAMDIDVVFDASSSSKRVKRGSAGNDSVEPSAREDASSPDLGMRAWKPTNGHRGKFAKGNSTHLIWKPKSSSFTSDSLEKGYSIVAQHRVGNENGKNEFIISPDEGNSFPFQRSDARIRGKEAESKSYHRQNFPVMGPSISNRSIMRHPDKIASYSKKDKEVYSNIELSEGVSSHELNSDRMHSGKKKGKLNLDMDVPEDMRHSEPIIQSGRGTSLFRKGAVTIVEEQGSCFESYQNLGWRNAHDLKINMNKLSRTCHNNYKEKFSSSYLPEWRQGTDIEDKDHANVICKSPEVTTQNRISNPHHGQAFHDPVVRRRNYSWKKHMKGKNKCNSFYSNFGEASSSILNQPSYPQSRAGASNLKLDESNKNRCHGNTLIKIDDLYPEERCCNSHAQQSGVSDNSSANASQIESDEIFARHLQEQFYHETTRFIDNEVDETIAWALQHDENAKSILFNDIRSKLASEVDLETRLDLWEAMEYLHEDSDMVEYDDDLAVYHFSNNTDYVMPLDLDESNHQHISSSEINNLPLSFIQNDNEDACAVCLEIPSIGETMRHLPCLHKFHKKCIDTWLKRKLTCPVCKFTVT